MLMSNAVIRVCAHPSRDAAEGAGKLVDAHTVEVALTAGGTERITAKHILLAVGGRAVKAPIEGAVRYDLRRLRPACT
jgi:pyruvate/2-oxoglutarate dehydrogenase complex dihydrolipoamide dehydrogenase (E3) component